MVLTLHGGRLLDSAQVSAIVHLISSSVPEMSAKNVTVVDQAGTLLSALQDDHGMGLDTKQVKYVQQIEQNYIRRIESILTPLLGASNVRAQVTASIDFARTEQTAEIYKPNQNPSESSIRSQQSLETLNGTGLSASGVPGALSNQPPVPATAPIIATTGATGAENSAQLDNLHKENTVNYEVDRTISHTILPVGMIKRLSVAVVINNRKVTDPKGKISLVPLSDAEKVQIDNLVKDAVGFDPNRGDSLNIQNAAFNDEKEVVEEIPLWQQPEMIELAKQLAKYLIIAVVMLIVVFKIIKPAFRPLERFEVTDHETASETAGTEAGVGEHAALSTAEGGAAGVDSATGHYTPPVAPYEQNLNIARQIAQQDPKIVASVIRDWVNGNE